MIAPLISFAILALHWTLAVAVCMRVLLKRRARGAAFAWIVLVLAVPYLGAAMYLTVGEVWLPRWRRRRLAGIVQASGRHPHAMVSGRDFADGAVPGVEARVLAIMSRQAASMCGAPMTWGNGVELLDGAEPAFARMIRDIDEAAYSCNVLSYIWHAGGAADQLAEALRRAAARGVDCRVLLDARGSAEFFETDWPQRLRDAGVKVAAAFPLGRLTIPHSRIDIRNHRKITVIDGRIGYTGSLNIADPALFKLRAGVGRWVDCMVRMTGPGVGVLQTVFLRDWDMEQPEHASVPDPPVVLPQPENDGVIAQVVPSGPSDDPGVLRQMLLTLVYSARKEVVLTTPYFVPDDATLIALTSAARGGVKVRVIVPKRVDAPLVKYASRACFGDLLRAGAEIHEFEDGLLHSKTVTIDGSIAMMGSANMDLRSFELNLEVSVFVYDPGFAKELRALQQRYMDRSTAIDKAAWEQRPTVSRMIDNVAQLFAPVL